MVKKVYFVKNWVWGNLDFMYMLTCPWAAVVLFHSGRIREKSSGIKSYKVLTVKVLSFLFSLSFKVCSYIIFNLCWFCLKNKCTSRAGGECLNTAKYCFTSPISESLECVCMDIHMNKRLTSSSIFWISELLPIDVCVNKVTRSHFIGVRCTRWNELTVITLKRWFLRNSSYKVCCWELWEICRFRILPSSEFPSGLEGPTTKRTSTKMTP